MDWVGKARFDPFCGAKIFMALIFPKSPALTVIESLFESRNFNNSPAALAQLPKYEVGPSESAMQQNDFSR